MKTHMSEIDRIYKYVYDVEALLKHREGFARQIRELQIESQLVAEHTLPNAFEHESAAQLEMNGKAMAQADEFVRASDRKLIVLTGRTDIDDTRRHVTQLKVGLGKIGEAHARTASAQFDYGVYKHSDNEEIRTLCERELESAIKDEAAYTALLKAEVPDSYSPNASIVLT
jgi:hypothetical protein